ncbi:hypothetical protein Tco_0051340 [Tanacetum coccineum]
MAALKYKEDHNKISLLGKGKEARTSHISLGYLDHSPLRYARLTAPPGRVYDSLGKQFWQPCFCTQQNAAGVLKDLVATIDDREVVVTLMKSAGMHAEALLAPHTHPVSPVREPTPEQQPVSQRPSSPSPTIPETEWVVPTPVSPVTDWRPITLCFLNIPHRDQTPEPGVSPTPPSSDLYTTHGGYHEESSSSAMMLATPTSDLAVGQRTLALLTSFICKADSVMGRKDSLETDWGKDVEENEKSGVPLRRKRSAYRRARTKFSTPAFVQFPATLSAGAFPRTAVTEPAGPSVSWQDKDRNNWFHLMMQVGSLILAIAKELLGPADERRGELIRAHDLLFRNLMNPDTAGGGSSNPDVQLLKWLDLLLSILSGGTFDANRFCCSRFFNRQFDEEEQIGMSRIAADPDSDDDVFAEIIFRGKSISGDGVVFVTTFLKMIMLTYGLKENRRQKWLYQLERDLAQGLMFYRVEISFFCSLHSDDVEDFWSTQDDWIVSSWKLYPKSSVHQDYVRYHMRGGDALQYHLPQIVGDDFVAGNVIIDGPDWLYGKHNTIKASPDKRLQGKDNGQIRCMAVTCCQKPVRCFFCFFDYRGPVFFCFFDDQLTNLSPNSCILPDILFLVSWQPAWSASAKAVRAMEESFEYHRPILMVPHNGYSHKDKSKANKDKTEHGIGRA